MATLTRTQEIQRLERQKDIIENKIDELKCDQLCEDLGHWAESFTYFGQTNRATELLPDDEYTKFATELETIANDILSKSNNKYLDFNWSDYDNMVYIGLNGTSIDEDSIKEILSERMSAAGQYLQLRRLEAELNYLVIELDYQFDQLLNKYCPELTESEE